jgi:hypothetical protein
MKITEALPHLQAIADRYGKKLNTAAGYLFCVRKFKDNLAIIQNQAR